MLSSPPLLCVWLAYLPSEACNVCVCQTHSLPTSERKQSARAYR